MSKSRNKATIYRREAVQGVIDFGDDYSEERVEAKRAAERSSVTKGEAADRRLIFFSLGSGSSGNAAYIGNGQGGVLIDAGVKADEIEKLLKDNGIALSQVKAICLTHDHSDHVRGAYTLLKKNKHIALFCTHRVLNGLLRRHNISKRIRDYHRPIFKEIPFSIAGMEFTAFDVPHDGTDNMGFSIEFDKRNFVIATDLGEVSERAHHYISRANYLVIEANYDARMLRDGPYPQYLKVRIANDHGHLDNERTAAVLAEIANPALKYIFLCHLSKDNNTPEKALETVTNSLRGAGFSVGDAAVELSPGLVGSHDILLMTLPRFGNSPKFIFRPDIDAEET